MRVAIVGLAGLLLAGCVEQKAFREERFAIDPPNRAPSAERQKPSREELLRAAGVVNELVIKAREGDRAYFAPLVQQPAASEAVADMMDMVKRAEMLKRFQDRMYFVPPTKMPLRPGHWRLDFHDPEMNVHFQVDLLTEADPWRVNRLYFCR